MKDQLLIGIVSALAGTGWFGFVYLVVSRRLRERQVVRQLFSVADDVHTETTKVGLTPAPPKKEFVRRLPTVIG